MVDSYWIGLDVPTDLDVSLIADDGWHPQDSDSTTSWQNIKSKSYKICNLDPLKDVQPSSSFGWKFIECEKVNAHFFRNFVTLGEDIMLDAFADNSYQVIGYQRDHEREDFSRPGKINWGNVISGFKPVAEVFR